MDIGNLTKLAKTLVPGVGAATAVKNAQGENFEEPQAYSAYDTTEGEGPNKLVEIAEKFGGILNILIFIVAAYLSWTCNSSCYKSMGIVEKVIRAFFAGFFGFVYIIIYFVSWSSDCNKCKEILTPQNPMEILPSQSIYF